MTNQAQSRIAAEVDQFEAIGGLWRDEQGPFRPLHLINPVRMEYLLSVILAPQARGSRTIGGTGSPTLRVEDDKLNGVNILDIACGGGLVCEPLARLGAQVTGIDTSESAIVAARAHAAAQGLAIDYQVCALEEFLDARSKKQDARQNNLAPCVLPLASQFDVITALEILEHVADPAAFVVASSRLLKPGGKIIFSTINRTLRSMLIAKIGAEYIANIVPRGTHDWKKFIQPAELAAYCEGAGLQVQDITGLALNPLKAGAAMFALSKNDVAVNYFLSASRLGRIK